MKLMVCFACNDVLALRMEPRTCACGRTSGRYVDGLNAVIYGDADGHLALGFANSSFRRAIGEQREHGDLPCSGRFGGHPPGREFEAFILPADCPSMTYFENDAPVAPGTSEMAAVRDVGMYDNQTPSTSTSVASADDDGLRATAGGNLATASGPNAVCEALDHACVALQADAIDRQPPSVGG